MPLKTIQTYWLPYKPTICSKDSIVYHYVKEDCTWLLAYCLSAKY